MTTPTIFANGYTANSLKSAPKRVDGAPIHVRTTTTLPAGTATSANVGLLPFNKGAKVNMSASAAYVTDIDTATTATATLGWVYDDNVTYTNDVDGFATTSTAPQGGGAIAFSAAAGYSFVAEADGWIVYVVGGENVEVAGTITLDAIISY